MQIAIEIVPIIMERRRPIRSSSTPEGTSARTVPIPAAETTRLASENESLKVSA